MKKIKTILIAVSAIVLIDPSIWSQAILEVEGELTVNPTNRGINVHNNFIENVADPESAQDAATKVYVDNLLLSFGVSLGSAGVQGLLDAEYSPLTIINAGADTMDFIGLNHAGGIIFYIRADGTGLVAAPTDAPTTLQWGNSGGFEVGCNNFVTGATLTGIGDGATNTMTVLNAACDSTGSAFNYVDTLSLANYEDWFLPSQDELNEMWVNLADSDGDGTNTGPSDPNNIGNFSDSFYWSSSELFDIAAWRQNFFSGSQCNFCVKSSDSRVRAIRAF